MDALHCPTCGYNLTGLPENWCPECGCRFTLDEHETQAGPHVLAVIVVIVLVLAGVPVMFTVAWSAVAYLDVQGNAARSAFAPIFSLAMLVVFVVSGVAMGIYVVKWIGPSTAAGAVGLVIAICAVASVVQFFIWASLELAVGGFPMLD